MTLSKCQATNLDGNPCGAAHWKDGWCRWHAPELAEQRQAWSVKGGKQSSTKARVKKQIPEGAMTTPELHALLCIVLKGTLTGKIDKGIANAVANVARAIRDVAGAAEIEERLAELEQRINGRGIA